MLPGFALVRGLVSGEWRVSRVSWSPSWWFALLFDPARAFGPRSVTVLRFRPLPLYGEGQRVTSLFRGSITRLSTSLSTLHAAITNDYARLAYGAALLAFRRDSDPLGRRCGVSTRQLSPGFPILFSSFVSLILVPSSWFLFSGFSRRHAFARRQEGQGEGQQVIPIIFHPSQLFAPIQ